uniref:Geranylgeranyl transferase type-2 subunit alpha n=1 Tax=Myotis myotis TaxID=51298 RepID=A0A7J8AQH7_MYOMY|nr:Rab geranylgeranyltransferase subunit alpha [Myotis myotis]
MHGRLKVKTSEEQAEAKRLEREQKLKLYRSATQTVFQKRQAGELDESVLELTSQILGANPDFATLWNCRREVFQRLEAQKSPEELAALVKAELGFLESCTSACCLLPQAGAPQPAGQPTVPNSGHLGAPGRAATFRQQHPHLRDPAPVLILYLIRTE